MVVAAFQKPHICSRFASSLRCSGAEEAPHPPMGSLLSVQEGDAHPQAPVRDRKQMLGAGNIEAGPVHMLPCRVVYCWVCKA